MAQLLSSKWFYIAAVLVIVGAYLVSGLEVTDYGDNRATGGAKEIAAVHERDDLNVIFILIDTLRADRLSGWGYERETSPFLDSLVSNGISFKRNISQSSWTKVSMASLWTGLYPTRNGILRTENTIGEDATLPAEIFQDAGYLTASVYRNGWVAPNFGFAQGFDTYFKPKINRPDRETVHNNPSIKMEGTDLDTVLAAMAFLDTHQHDQFFLYLHFMDVHQYVYDQDTALFGTAYSDLYDNSIRWTDRNVEFLIDHLNALGLRERTLVVIASDHGEAFGEHGREGHARDLYMEVTHTPVILSLPFRLEEGIEIGSRTANVDVWPTVLDLMGLPAMEETDGRSQMPQILSAARGEEQPERADPIFAEIDSSWGQDQVEHKPVVAVTLGNQRLIRNFFDDQRSQAYDLESDPRESRDLSSEEIEWVSELEQAGEEHQKGELVDWAKDSELIELDALQLNQLRALGYSVQ